MRAETVIGIALIIFGVIAALWGDRAVQEKEKDGIIARLVSGPGWWVRIIKWPMGLALVAVGVWILLNANQL